MKFYKLFLLLFFGIIFPFTVYAEENECVLNGGECIIDDGSCKERLGIIFDDACSTGEVCCESSESSPTADYYEEGSTGGFLFLQGHIVPCGRKTDDIGTTEIDETDQCTLCHLFIMSKNIFDLMFSLLIVTAILFITIGGILYIVSTGNSTLTGMAKNIIKKTLIGFALMLGGWLLVYTLLVFLSAGDMVGTGGNWYEFNCDTASRFDSSTTTTFSEDESLNRSRLAKHNIKINKNPPATQVAGLTDETIKDLISFQSDYGSELVITGGSEGGHASGTASHGNGQKVDLRLSDTLNSYIESNFTPFDSSRTDVSASYTDGKGNYYYLENDHWDVCYGSNCKQT